MNRRKFIATGSLGAAAMAINPNAAHSKSDVLDSLPDTNQAISTFWPGNARLAISISYNLKPGVNKLLVLRA